MYLSKRQKHLLKRQKQVLTGAAHAAPKLTKCHIETYNQYSLQYGAALKYTPQIKVLATSGLVQNMKEVARLYLAKVK